MENNFLNKKAQGMSTSTIVLLILGIIILVVLVLGFTIGWSKLAPWVKSNNIPDIKSYCDISCQTSNQYGYCSVLKEVDDGVNDKFEDTCYNLANDPEGKYSEMGYGIAICPQISCP